MNYAERNAKNKIRSQQVAGLLVFGGAILITLSILVGVYGAIISLGLGVIMWTATIKSWRKEKKAEKEEK
jgi:hypothetical protein